MQEPNTSSHLKMDSGFQVQPGCFFDPVVCVKKSISLTELSASDFQTNCDFIGQLLFHIVVNSRDVFSRTLRLSVSGCGCLPAVDRIVSCPESQLRLVDGACGHRFDTGKRPDTRVSELRDFQSFVTLRICLHLSPQDLLHKLSWGWCKHEINAWQIEYS